MKKNSRLSLWIPLIVAIGACSNDTVDPAASVTPADARRTSSDVGVDSTKFLPAPGAKVPNAYIVKTHTEKDAEAVATQLTAEHTATVKYIYPSLPGLAVRLPNPEGLPKPPDLGKLLEDRRIVRVSEERILETVGVRPSEEASLDTQTALLGWNLDKIDSRTFASNGTYRYEERTSTAPVYVIDTGIASSHSDFGGRVLPGKDFVGSSDGRVDTDGHGTAVASVIGGSTLGVAKTVPLIPVRVWLGEGFDFEESDLLAGLEWVRRHNTGFSVANISSVDGEHTRDPDIDRVVRQLVADGVTTVVGAGNKNIDACDVSPGHLREVITVSGVDSTGARAVWSDGSAAYGTCVDIWAPGRDVPAARGKGYLPWHGTSLAAPHVAAVAWLILREENNRASPAHIKDVIRSSATEGRLNVNGTDKFLYAPRSVAWIGGLSSVTSAGSYTWTGRGWGGYSLTYLWEASTDGGTTWTSVGTTNRYTRSFGDNESHTLSLKLTVTNDFGERPSVTWEIPVNTGCGEATCVG